MQLADLHKEKCTDLTEVGGSESRSFCIFALLMFFCQKHVFHVLHLFMSAVVTGKYIKNSGWCHIVFIFQCVSASADLVLKKNTYQCFF